MEKLTDEVLELFANMPTIDAVDVNVKSMATELLALRADAETSQNHNAAVMDRLYAEMEAAGYTGTWTDKVRQACECKAKLDMYRDFVTSPMGTMPPDGE